MPSFSTEHSTLLCNLLVVSALQVYSKIYTCSNLQVIDQHLQLQQPAANTTPALFLLELFFK